MKQALDDVAEGRLVPPHGGAVFWSDHPWQYEDKAKDNNARLQNDFCKAAGEGYKALWMMPLSLPTRRLFADETIGVSTRKRIAGIYSKAFAESASGIVYMAVDRSKPDSFFRFHELFSVMANPLITHVARLNRDASGMAEAPVPKDEWLLSQQEQWLADSLSRLAENPKKSGRHQAALADAVSEIIILAESFNDQDSLLQKANEALAQYPKIIRQIRQDCPDILKNLRRSARPVP